MDARVHARRQVRADSTFDVTRIAAVRTPGSALTSVRLDKWLWSARFYRTRSLDVQAIDAGHVRVNGERVKQAYAVRPAVRISVRKRELVFEVEVTAVAERRGSATEAARLYRETQQSIDAREVALREGRAARAQQTPGRPTKRDRRRLEDFLNEP